MSPIDTCETGIFSDFKNTCLSRAYQKCFERAQGRCDDRYSFRFELDHFANPIHVLQQVLAVALQLFLSLVAVHRRTRDRFLEAWGGDFAPHRAFQHFVVDVTG